MRTFMSKRKIWSSVADSASASNILDKQQRSLVKYELQHIEFISDTGIFRKSRQEKLRAALQPTSTIKRGPYIYFFKKMLSTKEMVLHRLDIRNLQKEADVIKEYKMKYSDDSYLYFSQQPSTYYSKNNGPEDDYDGDQTLFLNELYIQVVNHNIADLMIYKMSDLTEPFINQEDISDLDRNTKFNQFFVLNPGKYLSYFQKLIKMDYDHTAIYLISFYNSNYSIATKIDNIVSVSVYDYIKNQNLMDEEDMNASKISRKSQSQKKKNFLQSQLSTRKTNVSFKSKTHMRDKIGMINSQVRCIQRVHILKYDAGRPIDSNKCYFDYEDVKLNQSQKEFQFSNFDEFIQVWFFIDEFGQIQLLRVFDEDYDQGSDCSDKDASKWNQEQLDYYIQHIKTRIGYAQTDKKYFNQIKATYFKNNTIYEDKKFLGTGLVDLLVSTQDYFKNPSQVDFLVGENQQFQYLYIYKQHNFFLNNEFNYDGNSQNEEYGDEFTFNVIKIMNHKRVGNNSQQKEQILQMLNQSGIDIEIYSNQLRLNQKYQGVLSNWISVQLQAQEGKPSQVQLPLGNNQDDELQTGQVQNMMIETFGKEDERGKYMILKIIDIFFHKTLESNQFQAQKKKQTSIRFQFVPKTYFFKEKMYSIVFEMRADLKIQQEQYSFVAANFLVNYSLKQIQELSRSIDGNDAFLLMDQTKVQLINPLSQQNSEKNTFMKLSREMKLRDFRIEKTRFLKIQENNPQFECNQAKSQESQDESEDSNDEEFEPHEHDFIFRPDAFQLIFNFEQIVDSKLVPKFVPFLSFCKYADKLGKQGYRYQDYMITAFYWHKDQLYLTNSCIVNLKQCNHKSVTSESSMLIWRTSDIFNISSDEYVVHYDFSTLLSQRIDRTCVQDIQLKIKLKGEKTKLKAKIIGRSEKLISSIKTLHHEETTDAITQRWQDQDKQRLAMDEDFKEILKKFRNHIKNDELIQAKAVNIPEFYTDGLVSNPQKAQASQSGFQPMSQAYRTPFQEFGYYKEEKSPREFIITFYSRMSKSCLKRKIFNNYEMIKMRRLYIQSLMQMKHVLFKDFDFLLLPSYQSYDIGMQVSESFFQQQELFLGKTMSDIYINDADQLSKSIRKYTNELEKQSSSNELDKKNIVQQIEGSLIEYIIQNNPYAEFIKENSELHYQQYLILSLDFNMKSQIMRCKDIKADNSFKVILDSVNKINDRQYCQLIEHDLFQLLNPDKSIKLIFPFFDVSNSEELIELETGQINSHCNFEFQLKGETVPISWNVSDQKMTFDKFRDDDNQIQEIIEKLRTMSSEIKEEDKNVEVKFKLVNFQQVKLGEKIRMIQDHVDKLYKEDIDKANCHFDKFEYIFDNLDLAQIMLQEGDNKPFYELETAQQIVDAQFLQSRAFFKGLFLFYLIGFVLPFYVEMVWQEILVSKICYSIGLFTQSAMFIIELGQMRYLGWDYFNSYMNLIDASQFTLYSILFYYNIRADSLEDINNEIVIILKMFCIFQTITKSLNFIKIFEEFGFLVRMLYLTFKEMMNFMVLFMILTLIFSMIYSVLQIQVDNYNPFDETQDQNLKPIMQSRRSAIPHYPGVHQTIAMILYSFRNAIGDFTTPNYDIWLIYDGEDSKYTPEGGAIMIYIIWIVWFLNGIVQVIMLLNFLIAVISQTYESVVSQQIIYTFTDRAEINLEYFQIVKQFRLIRKSKAIRYMVFVESSDIALDTRETNWTGFVNTINYHSNKLQEKLKSQMRQTNHKMNQKMEEIQREQRSQKKFQSEMKSHLFDKVKSIETELQELMESNKEILMGQKLLMEELRKDK